MKAFLLTLMLTGCYVVQPTCTHDCQNYDQERAKEQGDNCL